MVSLWNFGDVDWVSVCIRTYLYVKVHMQTFVYTYRHPTLVPFYLQGDHSDAVDECWTILQQTDFQIGLEKCKCFYFSMSVFCSVDFQLIVFFLGYWVCEQQCTWGYKTKPTFLRNSNHSVSQNRSKIASSYIYGIHSVLKHEKSVDQKCGPLERQAIFVFWGLSFQGICV